MDNAINRPRRLKHHDYGGTGLYFVTAITRNGACVLWDWRSVLADSIRQIGEAPDEEPLLSECGEAARHYIQEIEHHYAGVKVEKYCILPNHVHMLIRFGTAAPSGRLIAAQTTLPTVIQQMKQAMTKHLGISVWARTYIDRVVRDDREAELLGRYIDSNVRFWQRDSLCPKIPKDRRYDWQEILKE